MRSLRAPLLMLLILPGVSAAQGAPEELLPGGCQLYLRWDGIAAHRDAYRQTALGKMMQGDMGTFLENVFHRVRDGLGTVLTVEQLLGGAPPEKLQQMQADATEAARLIPLLGEHGFVLALHVASLDPPQGQVSLVIPDGGEKAAPVVSALRLAASLNKVPIQEKKVGRRTVYHVPTPFVHLSWWIEGKHAVVHVGTATPEEMITRIDRGKEADRLTASPLYRRVAGFKEFRTSARAFLDTASLVKMGQTRGAEVSGLLSELGVDGLKSIVLYSGFDGAAERGLLEVDMPGPRKGLLALLEGKPFRLEDVPALPPDVSSFTMTTFRAGATYDVVLEAIQRITAMVAPDELPQVKEGVRQMNLALGIDLRKDLLEALGDRLAYYIAPSEGPLNLGGALMIKVKDGPRVLQALEQMIKGLARTAGGDVRLTRRTYHGVEVREVHIKQQGMFFVPTYAIHKDWLVISYFPQPVHGYLLRATGAMEAWKPDAHVARALESLPREMTSLAISDPRPGIRTLLSLAPLVAGLANSFNPEPFVDVGAIPHGQEVTRHLFPNVSVGSDDGKVLRMESRSSLELPLQITGIDSYMLLVLFASFARIG